MFLCTLDALAIYAHDFQFTELVDIGVLVCSTGFMGVDVKGLRLSFAAGLKPLLWGLRGTNVSFWVVMGLV